MLKIAVCDDEIQSAKILENFIKSYGENHMIDFECDIFSSGEDLLKSDISQYMVLFLDVEMENINGIETARILRIKNEDIMVVYVSGMIKYAPMGYNVNAFRYILKRDLEAIFEITMGDIIEKLNLTKKMFAMDLEIGKKDIPIKNIVFIESYKRKVTVHTINWEEKQYEYYARLSDLSLDLAIEGFLRIHKSYLVNMQYISKLKDHEVHLKNDIILKASARSWQDILEIHARWRGNV